MQWLDNVIVQNILNELKQKKIKQSELAKGVGLSKETIAQRLNGTRSLSAIEMQRVADFLGVSLTYLTKNYNETGYISKETAQTYLNFNPKDINGYIDLTGKAKRWHTIDPTRTLWGSLPENLLRNSQNYTLSEERIEKENEKFAKIKERCRELFIC